MTSRGWWRCIGVVLCMALIVALIGVGGPLLALGSVRPLESVQARGWVIGMLLFLGFLRLVWWWRRRRARGLPAVRGSRARDATYDGLGHDDSAVGAQDRTDHDAAAVATTAAIDELRARFFDACSLLRRARSTGSRVAAWLDVVTGQYAYRLPWYLVVGNAGSGKTTLIGRGGLEWSMAEQVARAAAGRVEPTRQCEWWLGNDAVLIDTPGRYLAAADASSRLHAEWRELLALLRKHRSRQPLNGVLLTVAIDELLDLDPAALTTYATRLRKPLQAMRDVLGMQVPVYLCFTRMDRIGGFSEYFSALNRDAREQVWGTAFPSDEAGAQRDAASPGNAVAVALGNAFDDAFDGAFDALAKRLNEGLRDVVIADPDLDSRALAYMFPQQFASLRDVLGGFCSALFQTSRLEANLFARGVYFTSAVQDGLTVDRVLATVGRDLGDAVSIAALTSTVSAASTASAASTRSTRRASQSYFIKQLLRDAIFADAGIAGASRVSWRRRLFAHTAFAISSAALLLTLLTGWAISYANNRAYLDEVGAHVVAFDRDSRQSIASPPDALMPLVPMLDALRVLPYSARFDTAAPPPLGYGLGLYPGANIAAASETLYRRALDEKLLPQAAARLEPLLRTAPPDDDEYAYDALKAYLMLHDAAHYDGGFLVAWLMLDAQRSLPADTPEVQRARLDAHLSALFDARPLASPFALNAALVSQVRERLAHASLAQRIYRQMRRELLRSERGAPISVVSAGGPQAALVFRRTSGKPLSDGIPSLYTYRGYWDMFDKRVAGATAQLRSEEPWVLGIDATTAVDTARLALEVRRAYFSDYIDVWDAYLNDLSLVDSTSIAQSTRIARTLSAPDSPLRQFLLAAARETHLSRADTADGRAAADGMRQQHSGALRRSLAAMFGGEAARGASGARGVPGVPAESVAPGAPGGFDAPQAAFDTLDAHPEAVVDEHFASLRRLVTSPDGASGTSPFDANLHALDTLYGYLTSASAALDGGNPPPSTDVFDKLQADAGRLPTPLRNMFGTLSRNASAQVGGALRANLAQDAQGGIGRLCRHMITGRYPFVRNSTHDVALDDFSKLFAPGGLMDDFFQKRLTSQIDASGARWRFRRDASGAASGDARLASAFQNADIIRTAFFPANTTTPTLRIEFVPLELDPAIAQYTLDVDGQTLRYAHGPQIPVTMQWPNPGGTGQVSLQIGTANGGNGVQGQQGLQGLQGGLVGGVQNTMQNSAQGGLQTQGPWALYRLLDKARVTPGATPESFVASFDFNGRKLSLRVTASSSYNPFRLPQMDAFSCPS
ncbi:type VI secretion system membrane subunit TssM [Paraburkholderia sp. D15]|uniref:type VI secretion system membrane subunit TssM n=1 Tax=Paraburkholderia sp. D15 TaxID=2880218 RepID=UPI0024791F52|nr:type VI secretion system membrane subunit TssM [Paraburkholderia sp. D15]WGS49456.1 type VI secretion system membrane subunit TssM [Paraburkholderia sp. D15]